VTREALRACIAGALLTLGIVVIVLVFAACGAEERKDTNAPSKVDRSGAEVIAMPNRFRNIAHKCDGHGHRVYSNSTGDSGTASQIFVIDDPSCPGGVKQ